ncbi:hypothetical protein FNV43_RR11263 [Rhamnella rubrinervis]|uniref:PGG domain-containing protein n=1 Tax=Rhamnella rubrinervis TaxID=2594499 RepID=A0A8K0H5T2_9ROSA|nr:hypothetical protein FNV43_RR11263 [Rhamnella rubrinervis]
MEDMTSRLYSAAVKGSVTDLLELLQQDRLILDRLTSANGFTTETPLHVAAMLGHTQFVKEILDRKPQLAKESDSQRYLALHLASAKGHVEIVKALVFVSPVMCFARDKDGLNPLQLAAIKGRIGVVRELVKVVPDAARATCGQGETILHLCVKHNQLDVIRLLVDQVMGNYEFVNAKDHYGMTILHLAVADKQIETTRFLVTNTSIEVNAVNANGFTALDLLAQSHRDIKDFDISESLRIVGALRTIDAPPQGNWTVPHGHRNHQPEAAQNNLVKDKNQPPEDWLTRKRDSLMVVASLIATMAFQSGSNPPGGLWQDDLIAGDSNNNTTRALHMAGKSIMADKKPNDYAYFLYSNTLGFVASLSIILLLVTGLPFKKRLFMWVLTVTVWVTITAMALTYRISVLHFTPSHQVPVATRVVNYGLYGWSGIMALVFLLHFGNLVIKFDKMVEKIVGEKR